jgi:DNA-binding transcriptional ArsR family regulator
MYQRGGKRRNRQPADGEPGSLVDRVQQLRKLAAGGLGSVVREDADLSPELLQLAAARFGLLASTMRLHIVWVLSRGETDVGGLADAVGGTLQAVSQHLAKLKLAGLVRSRREGRRHVYLVDDPHLVMIVKLAVEQLQLPAAEERRGDLGA